MPWCVPSVFGHGRSRSPSARGRPASSRFDQLFVRAVIFRLVTALVFARRDVTHFEPVVEVARSIAG